MAEKRVSSLIALDELQKTTDMAEVAARMDATKSMEAVRARAMEVLGHLAMSQEFNQLFLVHSIENLSAFVFTYLSDRIIVMDMLARCPREQAVNFETYKFTSHPEFEKKISYYTRMAEKPNSQLAKCRSWDVALNLIVKVEALDAVAAKHPSRRLLYREYCILKTVWDYYMRENMELDEMTGIPLMFRYEEIPNTNYVQDSAEHKVYDQYGNLVPLKSDHRSNLSYLCMEQMGPSVQYLMDVMMSSKRRVGYVFDIDTAFKVLDQLICRCLQLHRFGVVHNAVEPSNLFFGRSIAFNVLYIINYNAAVVFDMKEMSNMRKSSTEQNNLYGSLRFASHQRLRGSQPHPVHDLESAFYTLIAMLTNNLPWDSCSSTTGVDKSTGSRSPLAASARASMATGLVDSNLSNLTHGTDGLAKAIEKNSRLQKMREFKANFWRSSAGIARVLADMQYTATGQDRQRISLAAEIIKELYAKIRDLLNTVGSDIPATSFFSNLLMQHTSEYQIYTDLRRTVLMMFRFESLSAQINTPTYQKKIESLAHEESEKIIRVPWNLTNWCFNAVEVTIDSGGSGVRPVTRNVARTVN